MNCQPRGRVSSGFTFCVGGSIIPITHREQVTAFNPDTSSTNRPHSLQFMSITSFSGCAGDRTVCFVGVRLVIRFGLRAIIPLNFGALHFQLIAERSRVLLLVIRMNQLQEEASVLCRTGQLTGLPATLDHLHHLHISSIGCFNRGVVHIQSPTKMNEKADPKRVGLFVETVTSVTAGRDRRALPRWSASSGWFLSLQRVEPDAHRVL